MRHVFYRDFTMARAVVLAGLIALAVCVEVPAQIVQADGARIAPAAVLHDAGCDTA